VLEFLGPTVESRPIPQQSAPRRSAGGSRENQYVVPLSVKVPG
jgi:hypothetical protein